MRALVILFVACLAVPAHAQPAADPGQAAYDEGRRLYDQHKWTAAVAQFKESYRLRRDAASLFNIAQSYRLDGDCVQAIAFYRTYKQEYPDATNLGKVNKFITELEPCAKAHEPKPESKPEPPRPPPHEPRAPPPPPPAPAALTDEGRGRRITELAIAGGGALVVATGFYFGSLAASYSKQVQSGSGEWDPSLEQAGKRDDVIAKVLWGVGGAAIVGGTVMYLLGRSSDTTPRVALVPAHDGGFVLWRCGF